MLVPMYFLIGVLGGPRKLYAAIKFFLYTLVGSVLLLLGILSLYFTYPYFWEQLGQTTAFRTYPLWIANYGVSEPQLPGGWRSYAIWQYTASGHVPGIPGRVDLDRLNDRLTLADVSYRPEPMPPAPKHNFPGPVPKPGWFWPWVRWRLDRQDVQGRLGQRVWADQGRRRAHRRRARRVHTEVQDLEGAGVPEQGERRAAAHVRDRDHRNHGERLQLLPHRFDLRGPPMLQQMRRLPGARQQ